MVARSVADVVLAEAGGRTEQERFADMLAIVSAIANRASKTGVSWESIVGAKDKRGNPQFDALGGKMPAGSEKYRELAERAIAHVKANGPTHAGVFYATPSKVGNLPNGLTKVAETAKGHQYFADPLNRSILTSSGYVVPVAASATAFPSLPETVPTPPMRPASVEFAPERGKGLAALVDFDLGPKRPNAPDQSIQDIIQKATEAVLGPGAKATIFSGMEDAGKRYGSNRHGTGFAADVRFTDAAGRPVNVNTNAKAMVDIAKAASALGATGIGMGKGYMDGDMHIDRVDAALPGKLNPATQSPTWMSLANANRQAFAEARATGIMPTPDSYRSTGIPTPTPRDVGLTLPTGPVSLPPDRPMNFPAPAPAYDIPVARLPDLPATAKAGVGLRAADIAPVAFAPPQNIGIREALNPPAMPAIPTAVPESAKSAYQQLAATLGSTGAKNLSGVGVPTMAPPMPAPREISNKPIGYHFPSTPPAPARIAASTFPAAPRPPAEIPYAARPPSEKRTATAREVLGAFAKGALFGGIPGAIGRGLDKALTVNNPGPGQWGGLGNALSGLNPFAGPGIFTPLGGAERFGVGSADAAMFGPRGATYTASNGTTIGGLGNGYSNRTSGQYGWTETVDPSGSVVGIDYGNGGGGLAGLLSGLFDGGGKSGKGK